MEKQRDWLEIATHKVRDIGIDIDAIEYAWEPHAVTDPPGDGDGPRNADWTVYDRLVVAQIEAFSDKGPFYLNVLGHRHGGVTSLEAARYVAYEHLARHLQAYKNPLMDPAYQPVKWARR